MCAFQVHTSTEGCDQVTLLAPRSQQTYQQTNHSIIFSSDADSSMSSVGCLRNQWCFNKSLALGRLISFLFRHKLTNSASSFEKMFSGTLGACDHAMYSQACSAAPLQPPCSTPAVPLRCACGAHAEGVCTDLDLGVCVHGPGYVSVAR